MKKFLSSQSGIILQLAAVLTFLGGGAAAIFAGSGLELYVLTGSTLVAISLGIFGVGLATIDHPEYAAAAVGIAPVLLFAHNLFVWIAIEYMPTAGFASVALGFGVLIAMAAGLRGVARETKEGVESAHAHA